MSKSIVIAGGAGFIGTHLVYKFIDNGYTVHVIDNGITASYTNIKYLKTLFPKVWYYDNDVEDWSDRRLPDDVQGILHFASPASPVDYLNFPLDTLRANIQGTYNLCMIAQVRRIPFLFASTSEIYGDPLVHPQTEEYWGNVNPIGPRSVYDEAKRVGETYTALFHRQYGVDSKIIRIFNTYGPRMRANDGRVVSNFINQALKGQPITIYGDGSQTRSFCYVSDLVEGIYQHFVRGDNTPINLGNPDEFTVLELANMVKELTNSNSEIIFKSLPQDDPKQRKPDITKAKNSLQWEPKVKLQEGLIKTIEHFSKI